MNFNKEALQSLVGYFNSYVPISIEEYTEDFLPVSTVREYSKKEVILREGETEEHLSLIVSGAIRHYYLKDAEEYTTLIQLENNLTTNHVSFFGRTPSAVNIEALEPTVLYSIKYNDLEELFAKKHKYERLGRLVVIAFMAQKEVWFNSLARDSARERFLKFINANPDILQRVSQKIISSYLQIKPETFSRFKHLVRNKHNLN